MSHSQFHCTARVHLHMHGLIFETSICYWQDQPGSRAPGHRPTPARRLSAGKGAHRERPTPAAPPASPRPTGEGAAAAAQLSAARAPGSLSLSLAAPFFFLSRPHTPARARRRHARRRRRRGTGRPGLTRPPRPADRPIGGDAPGTAPAAAAGATDVLEENATSRRARAPATGAPTTPGRRAPQRTGDAATKSAHTAAAAPTRRGDAPPPSQPTGGGTRRAALSRSLARPRCFWHIVCGHPRRLAARGRHPPGPGPRPAPAPRATLTDPCGSRGRSAVTQPASAGKAPSFGDENDGRSADQRPGHAP